MRGKQFLAVGLLMGCLASTGCGPQLFDLAAEPTLVQVQSGAQQSPEFSLYRFGPGDRLKVIVFGQEEISGEYEINETGILSIRLIGKIEANLRTIAELEQIITEAMAKDYLVDPRVTIEVTKYRPFFILGEVKSPGSYGFANGLVARMAVAMAGGYTRRARDTSIIIIRPDSTGREVHYRVGLDEPVLPGDTLNVERRLF